MITSNGMALFEYACNKNTDDEYDYEKLMLMMIIMRMRMIISDKRSSSNDCEIVPGPSKKPKVAIIMEVNYIKSTAERKDTSKSIKANPVFKGWLEAVKNKTD